jgi:hypothetical protein
MVIMRLAFLILISILAMPAQAETCTPVDAFTPAQDLARETAGQPPDRQAAAFNEKIIARFAPLYAEKVLGIGPGAERDKRIVASLDKIRSGAVPDSTKSSVLALVPKITDIYAKTFSDFHCNFPIYLMDSLGQLDGAGRFVDGRPSLVIGIETLAGESAPQRPVFLAHEFFHRYHFQAAGFSDDAGDSQAIWRVLWAEGMATYVSMKLTPGATLSDALILPANLEARSKPMLPAIAARLSRYLDVPDVETFNLLFTYGGPQAPVLGLPWRSGYYVGFLVAADLGKTRTIDQLAHLQGPMLHDLIRETLAKIGAKGYRPE